MNVLSLLILVGIQDTLTGLFGAPGIISTMIASQAMRPRRALILSTITQFIGPFLFGVAVASAIGSEVIETSRLTPPMIYAALIATIFWMVAAWYWGIPSSSTHALIGGLVGVVVLALGPWAIHTHGLLKILVSLSLTAPLGVLVAFIITRLCYRVAPRTTTKRNKRRFNRGQFLASLFLGCAIGSNNAQNVMGVTILGLITTGYLDKFEVPIWVIAMSAIFLAVGNLMGGMRVAQSVGTQFYPIRPIHGFGAQTSSAIIILTNALVGGNVSTTHVTSMSILGAGAAEKLSLIQWRFVRRVLLTWVVTIPLTALLACLIYIALMAITSIVI